MGALSFLWVKTQASARGGEVWPQQSLQKRAREALRSARSAVRSGADQVRVMRTFDNAERVILPFADPRAYTDRLNELFTPSAGHASTRSRPYRRSAAWRGESDRDQQGAGGDAVTISRLGSHTGTGEEWADREMPSRRPTHRPSSAPVAVSGWAATLPFRRDPSAAELLWRAGCDPHPARVGAAAGMTWRRRTGWPRYARTVDQR